MSWFATWFDSPLYHILYQHRNEAEAERFIEVLLGCLGLEGGARIADVACGKGRHARQIAHRLPDSEVWGFDLAANSIEAAKSGANLPKNCHFARQDMLQPLAAARGKFDLLLNLFTSFGYFESDEIHTQVMRHWAAALKEGGQLVLDFINAERAMQRLVAEETQVLNGYKFDIRRKIEDGYIVKDIWVTENTTEKAAGEFQERVRAFGLEDFERIAAAAGLRVLNFWGDYELNSFSREESPRLILQMEIA